MLLLIRLKIGQVLVTRDRLQSKGRLRTGLRLDKGTQPVMVFCLGADIFCIYFSRWDN